MFSRVLLRLVALLLLAPAFVFVNCAPPEPCKGGKASSSTLNPASSDCQNHCDCSNQLYEGICVDGICKSLQRDDCRTRGQKRQCLPLESKEQSCKLGIQTCFPDYLDQSKWGNCEPVEKLDKESDKRDACGDGVDNDCDGKVDKADEDCVDYCNPGESKPCFSKDAEAKNITPTDTGACNIGLKLCNTEGKWSRCIGSVEPKVEVCNGLDDDCDGFIDNAKSGQEAKLQDCQGCQPAGARRACFGGTAVQQGVGICKGGFQTCTPGPDGSAQWGTCEGEVKPASETCNGLDDDCDGEVDEGLQGCKGCQPIGATQPCFDGPSGALNKGICKGGTQTCTNNGKGGGAWGSCVGQRLPEKQERCNGEDDDCDGEIDNKPGTTEKIAGCECWPPGSVDTCYDGSTGSKTKGSCHGGSKICQPSGKWGPCLKQQLPVQEECNLKDDDCDGFVDNAPGKEHNTMARECYDALTGCLRDAKTGKYTCKAPCQVGTQQCVNGNWSACQGQRLARVEVCNGIDDDCNGRIDDQIPEPPLCPNQKVGCAGSRYDASSCKNGRWPEDCSVAAYRKTFPQYDTKELCDDFDNNCSGQINENATSLPCVGTLAGLTSGFSGGKGTEAQFRGPTGLAIDKNGILYIANVHNSAIFRMDPCGNVTVVAGAADRGGYKDGKVTEAQFLKPPSVAVDTKGNVYVADFGNHRIRKIDTKGNVTTLAGSTAGSADGNGTSAQFNAPEGITVGPQDNVYVVDTRNHRIRKIDTAGKVTTIAGGIRGNINGKGTNARFNYPTQLIADTQGNLYVADTSNHRIRKIDPTGNVTTLAGSSRGYLDGKGTSAQFNTPRGLAVDAMGNVYVADSENRRIRKVDPAGNVTTLAGSTGGFKDGALADARFEQPYGLAIDAAGTLYVSSAHRQGTLITNKLRMIQFKQPGIFAKACVLHFSGNGSDGFVEGPPWTAEYRAPRGITLGLLGDIFIVDSTSRRIRKLGPDGTTSLFAGRYLGYQDGRGEHAKFDTPTGLTSDAKGNLYVADTNNHRIRKIDPVGNVTTIAGSTSGFQDGKGIHAKFNTPRGIVVGPQGNLYVSDADNHRIRKIDPAGNVTTIAGDGKSGYLDGKGRSAQFNNPHRLAIDPQGNLYVSDTDNHRIRKIDPAGNVTTIAGDGKAGHIDGKGLGAQFNKPHGIAVDAWGILYVVDRANDRIRRIDHAGNVTTLAGSGKRGYLDGAGAIAQFDGPLGIAVDTRRTLYITSDRSRRVRIIPLR